MALTLSAAFTREVAKADCAPVVLVNIGGLTGGKFVKASRNVLGYPANVLKVTARSSGLDPLTCKQTLNSLTIEFIDDGYMRALIRDNKLIGKTVTCKLGFDTGNDATFLEADYAGFTAGVFEKWETEPGIVRVVLKDPRSVFFERAGAKIKVPQYGDVVLNGEVPTLKYEGPACGAMLKVLESSGLSTAHYSAASYAPGASTATGHLQVYRRSTPGLDRALLEPTEVQTLLDQIGNVLRGYNLIREDGIMEWKEFNAAAAATLRFTDKDIIPGSVKCSQDLSQIVTSFIARTGWSQTGGFAMTFRDKDATGQADWSYTDVTDRPADYTIDDEWFTDIATAFGNVAAAATSFEVRTSSFAGAQNPLFRSPLTPNPNVVSATYPGYIFMRGTRDGGDEAGAGEIIKYTSITCISNANHGSDRYTIDGLTRGMFGTTARAHWLDEYTGAGPLCADITAVIRAGTEIIKRFREGATILEFETPLHTYSAQLADVVNVESDVFLRYAGSELAVGNTTSFEVIQKEVDIESATITWKLVEIRTASHTPDVRGGGKYPNYLPPGGSADGWLDPGALDPGGLFVASGSVVGRLAQAFLDGAAPATSATLAHSIPHTRASTIAGLVRLSTESHTYTASKDTYVDLSPSPGGKSNWYFTEVANGAAAPAVTTGDKRAFKVVTSGTAITTVTDMRDKEIVDTGNVKTGAITEPKVGTGAVTETKIGAGAITEPKIAAGAITAVKLAAGSIDISGAALGGVSAEDTFENRAGGSDLDNSNTTTGSKTWDVINGTFSVAIDAVGGAKGPLCLTHSSGSARAFFDCGASDNFSVEYVVNKVSNANGWYHVYRMVIDGTNNKYYMIAVELNSVVVYRADDAGTSTTIIGTLTGGALDTNFARGDRFRVELSGNTHNFYKNDSFLGLLTDSTYTTGKGVGAHATTTAPGSETILDKISVTGGTTPLSGTLHPSRLSLLGVTADKVATGAVTEAKIGALAVTEGKIGALAVTAAKLGANAVETSKVLDFNVTAAKISTLSLPLFATAPAFAWNSGTEVTEWAAFTLIFNGVSYSIASGSTALRYVWFLASSSTTVLQSSNTAPNTGATPSPLYVMMTMTDIAPPDATAIFLVFAPWSQF